jgi:aminodeoxyfutalosine synthase
MRVHPFQTDDPQLQPAAEKIFAGQRLNANDALALYRSGDILAVGWLANSVRERMYGNRTYFNVNRHINPTNVCVAACRLCAFGRKKDTPGAYTMALEEAFETAASGYTEAVTEFHIVGGLHPDLPFQYFLDLISGLKQRFPQVHLKAFTMVEVAYLSKRAKLSIGETLRELKAAVWTHFPGVVRKFLPIGCVTSSAITKLTAISGSKPPVWRMKWGSNRMPPCYMATWRTMKIASIT